MTVAWARMRGECPTNTYGQSLYGRVSVGQPTQPFAILMRTEATMTDLSPTNILLRITMGWFICCSMNCLKGTLAFFLVAPPPQTIMLPLSFCCPQEEEGLQHQLRTRLSISAVNEVKVTDPETPNENENEDDDKNNMWISDLLSAWDLKVATYSDDKMDRGLQTLRDRSPGEVLIAVPKQYALTQHSILEQFPDAFPKPNPNTSSTNDINNSMRLSQEQILAVGLLLLRKQMPENPFVKSLPRQQYAVIRNDMPEEILHCFPLAYQRLIRAYRQHVHEIHQSLLSQYHSKKDCDTAMYDLVRSREDFEWAFATIVSRSVGIAVDEANFQSTNTSTTTTTTTTDLSGTTTAEPKALRVMLPGFDFLNHDFGARVKRDFQNGSFVVVSDDAYRAGDQVFISYCYEENRDNLNILLTYGFCPWTGNPEQVIFFDSQDLLQACARARPQYFTPSILQQLNELLKVYGKDKELYPYDGSTKQPRPSLVKELAMMSEIEIQFLPTDNDGQSFDAKFPEHVLQALLQTRQEEIDRGLERAAMYQKSKQQQQDYDPGWATLLQSVQTLLSLEQEYLS